MSLQESYTKLDSISTRVFKLLDDIREINTFRERNALTRAGSSSSGGGGGSRGGGSGGSTVSRRLRRAKSAGPTLQRGYVDESCCCDDDDNGNGSRKPSDATASKVRFVSVKFHVSTSIISKN